MVALDTTQIDTDSLLPHNIDAVEVMLQQDIFGRNSRVGFEFEAPVAIRVLQPPQGSGGLEYGFLKVGLRSV
jgi:hypothetical protein